MVLQNVISPLTHISPDTLRRTTIRPVCARGRSLFLRPRDARCSREGSRRGQPSARKGGRGAGAQGEREKEGRRGGGETGVPRESPPPHPAAPRGSRPAREFLPGRLQSWLSGGGRKGFPVQEAAPAATASSLTLLSPAQPIPHSPRPRASRGRPLHSVRLPALPGSAPAPPPLPSGDP